MKTRYKDIILITGCNSTGKTTAYNFLRNAAEIAGVEYYEKPVHDFDFMTTEVFEDDKKGGLNHYHEWCAGCKQGHKHINSAASEPFVLSNNSIVDNTWKKFFEYIYSMPKDGKIKFVMWGGGRNILESSFQSKDVDYSYHRAFKMFNKKLFPTGIFDRVLIAINITADDVTREILNAKKLSFKVEDSNYSYKSPRKMTEVLRILGGDDFENLYKGLKKYEVSNIISIINNCKNEYLEKLESLSNLIFSHNTLIPQNKVRNIIFLGKAAAGKTEFINGLRNIFNEYGICINIISERVIAEKEVLKDVSKGKINKQGYKEGKHSILIRESNEGTCEFFYKDGLITENCEEEILSLLSKNNNSNLNMTEFIIHKTPGKGFRNPGITKDTMYFLKKFQNAGILDDSLIIELESPFWERLERHIKREDSYDIENFKKFYTDDFNVVKSFESGSNLNYFKFANYNTDEESRKFFLNYLFRRCIYPYLLGIKF